MKIKNTKTEWIRVRVTKPFKQAIEKKALSDRRELSDFVRLALEEHLGNGQTVKG